MYLKKTLESFCEDYWVTTEQKDFELYNELFINEATHIDLDSGEHIHIDNGVFVLNGDEWVQEDESKVRNLKPV